MYEYNLQRFILQVITILQCKFPLGNDIRYYIQVKIYTVIIMLCVSKKFSLQTKTCYVSYNTLLRGQSGELIILNTFIIISNLYKLHINLIQCYTLHIFICLNQEMQIKFYMEIVISYTSIAYLQYSLQILFSFVF